MLVTNSDIGQVENIVICGVDIDEVYGGSSFRGDRWKAYDGSQSTATPIIAGFKLPDTEVVEGGLTFRLPNSQHTGYIKNVQFHDVNLLVKGGHPVEDAEAYPPEIGVGRYNVVLDDVIGAEIKNLQVKAGVTDKENVKSMRSKEIIIK